MADDFTTIIGVAVVVFAVLSFLNTLGMHLALRAIKHRVDRICEKIERGLNDPVGYAVPLLQKAIQRLNDDKEFRTHVGGLLVYVGKSLYASVTGGAAPEPGDPKTPAKRGGILGKLSGLLDIGRALGFIKEPGAAPIVQASSTLPSIIDPNRPGWLK